MIMHHERRWVYFFGQGQADGGESVRHLVGGKGASLAEMTRAGLNVPPGFTISTECCDLFYENQQNWPPGLLEEVQANLQRLEQLVGRPFGRGDNPLLLAVRSGAAQSMPGMMDTVLNVGLKTSSPTEPWDTLQGAISAVFRSWNSERAIAYRKHHRIHGLLGTAVNVQMMCPAEVSGVLFTANPVMPALGQMIVESCCGLGEAIVLGKVTPDRFVLAKKDLAILERTISRKGQVVAAPTQDGKDQTGARAAASLRDEEVLELARLGQRVEEYFNYPCDIEWGLALGQFYLLQARAITFSANQDQRPPDAQTPPAVDAERELVRREEIASLRARAAPGGTVWARFNLAEILPEPTPMTWDIVRRFMSGQGGLGLMYRDLGFDPDPALDEEGIFDLVCGRPYCNLSREPKMQYRNLPFEHKFALLKANPAKAIYPQAVLNPARAGWRFWLHLPFIFFKVWRSSVRIRRLARTFARDFQERIIPAFLSEVDAAWAENLEPLTSGELLERLRYWIKRTLFEFARDSLKPTALAGIALGNLERVLTQRYQPPGTPKPKDGPSGLSKAQAALRELIMGVKPAGDTDLVGAIRDLAAGRLAKADFMRFFGHRGSQEMELARPRWNEEPQALEDMAHQYGSMPPVQDDADAARAQVWDRIAADIKLVPNQRTILEAELQTVHVYLGLREAGKHHFMRGYALIRRYLVEMDRRFGLDGGIFFLTLDEAARLAGPDGANAESRVQARLLIEERRRRRELALSLAVPQVLFSDDLEAIGRDVAVTAMDTLQGVPLSAGMAEGPAWVLDEAAGIQPLGEPYILVCPSTDPAWVPLFVKARGLIMETGGVLSHGAILARELGVPAVAAIADVHRRLKTGQRLRLDGATGKVTVLPRRDKPCGPA